MENFTFNQLHVAIFLILEKVAEIEKQLQVDVDKKHDHIQWLDLEGLCQYLPDKPAKPTVYAYVQHRSIPYHKKGKKLFFLKSEIDAWLKSGRRRTTTEIESGTGGNFTTKKRQL